MKLQLPERQINSSSVLSAKFPHFWLLFEIFRQHGDRYFEISEEFSQGFEQFHVEIMRFHEQRMFVNDQEGNFSIDVWVYKVERSFIYFTQTTHNDPKFPKKTSVLLILICDSIIQSFIGLQMNSNEKVNQEINTCTKRSYWIRTAPVCEPSIFAWLAGWRCTIKVHKGNPQRRFLLFIFYDFEQLDWCMKTADKFQLKRLVL